MFSVVSVCHFVPRGEWWWVLMLPVPMPRWTSPYRDRPDMFKLVPPHLFIVKYIRLAIGRLAFWKCFLVLHDIYNEFSRKTDSLVKCFRSRKNGNGISVFLDNDPLLSVLNMNQINAKYNRTRQSRKLMPSTLSPSWVHFLTCAFVLGCVHTILTVTITNTFSHLYVSADNSYKCVLKNWFPYFFVASFRSNAGFALAFTRCKYSFTGQRHRYTCNHNQSLPPDRFLHK